MKAIRNIANMMVAICTIVLFCALPSFGQGGFGPGGKVPAPVVTTTGSRTMTWEYSAWTFQMNGSVAVGSSSFFVNPPGTLSVPLAINNCFVRSGNGRVYIPFAVGTSLSILDGTNSETVTVTAVSVNTSNQCSVTATFANAHAAGTNMVSGSFGLYEAILDLCSTTNGGVVSIDANFPVTTTTLITSLTSLGCTKVSIEDDRAGAQTIYTWSGAAYVATESVAFGNAGLFGGLRPTTLTTISAPSAPTLATSATGGTISNATYRVCITYVDALGGESLCSSDGSSTIATSGTTSTITTTAPAASTGAVGWRLYISAAGGGASSEILYAPASAGCTVSTLVTTLSACAMSSNAVTTALITGTGAIPVQATAHTTIAGQTFNAVPAGAFQTSWGPFTAASTISTAQVIGELQLPVGYFNQLGKMGLLCGEIASTTLNTAVPTIAVRISPNFTISPVTIATWTVAGQGANSEETSFCIYIQTAATGATGTLEVHGWLSIAISTGASAAAFWNTANTGPSSAVDLTKQDVIDITFASGTANTTSATLRQLEFIPIN